MNIRLNTVKLITIYEGVIINEEEIIIISL